jgi:hypothetical protein
MSNEIFKYAHWLFLAMKNYFKVTKPFLIKASAILVFAIVLGTMHGFYTSAQRASKQKFTYGGDFCNGEYDSGLIRVTEIGENIMINYKVSVNTGNVRFMLIDPTGEVDFERIDEKPMFRQYSVIAKENSQLGNWEYRIFCEKADMFYELSITVANENA